MSDWDDAADGWDGDDATRAYAAAAFDSLAAVLDAAGVSLAGARVLDFGCGTGLLTEHLVDGGAAVVAMDTSRAMIAVLDAKVAERGWTTVRTTTSLTADSNDGVGAPGPFDLVVCSSVLGFVDDYPATVSDLASRLRSGGLFVQWDWERADTDASDTDEGTDDHGLSGDEIASALTAAGLVDGTVVEAFRIPIGEHTMAPLMGHGRAP